MVSKMSVLTPIENGSKRAVKNIMQKAAQNSGYIPKTQKIDLHHFNKDEYVSLLKEENPEIKTLGDLYKHLRKSLDAARSRWA